MCPEYIPQFRLKGGLKTFFRNLHLGGFSWSSNLNRRSSNRRSDILFVYSHPVWSWNLKKNHVIVEFEKNMPKKNTDCWIVEVFGILFMLENPGVSQPPQKKQTINSQLPNWLTKALTPPKIENLLTWPRRYDQKPEVGQNWKCGSNREDWNFFDKSHLRVCDVSNEFKHRTSAISMQRWGKDASV